MKAPTTTRRVLGIDPGYDRLGLAVIEGDASRPTHIWSECVTPPKGTAEMRLAHVYRAVSEAIETYAPSSIALETLFFSSNKKSALSVAEARGAVLAAAGAHHLPILEFSPGTVKLAVTGHGSADKKAIERMIPHLISLPVKKRLDDEFDAIAIAIAGLSTRR
jgi:crossover junction endodeoxyribonuclease RuvC